MPQDVMSTSTSIGSRRLGPPRAAPAAAAAAAAAAVLSSRRFTKQHLNNVQVGPMARWIFHKPTSLLSFKHRLKSHLLQTLEQ